MSKKLNIILFDGPERANLLPFTYVRPVAELRIGIDTLHKKWDALTGVNCSIATQDYLSKKFPIYIQKLNYFVNASYVPTESVVAQINNLNDNETLVYKGKPVVYCTTSSVVPKSSDGFISIDVEGELIQIETCPDLFSKNEAVLRMDFDRITKGRTSQELDNSNRLICPEHIFVEPGAQVSCAILNATDGPIYIGANVTILEGSLLRGAIALCSDVIVKMGTKIYGGTTVGPNSKVGGELNNVLFLGNSNKSHEGFLGNAVIGEWCNIGAATDASNMKNNYAMVQLWNYAAENFVETDLQFCGLLFGDYSRCAIHSMFNTATVVGVSSNIFGAGFPKRFIPSFSYGGAEGFETYMLSKAIDASKAMMERRGIELSEMDKDILKTVFEKSSVWRND